MNNLARTALLAVPLLLAAAAAPSSAFTGAGVQDATLYTYTDTNTGATATLHVSDGHLYCSWDAPATFDLDAFRPSYYFTKCYVQNADEHTSIGCATNSEEEDTARAVGSCKISETMPQANLRWWMMVGAADIRVVNTDHTENSTTRVDTWEVEAYWEPSAEIGLTFMGEVPIPSATVGAKAHIGGTYGRSETKYQFVSNTHEVSYSDVLMLSIGGQLVKTLPTVNNLGWEGKPLGCDALDYIEKVRGPREISEYTNIVKAKALSGQLTTDLGVSKFAKETSRGAFDRFTPLPHGFEATWGDDVPNVASALASLANDQVNLLNGGDGDGGMATFDSRVKFNVDYEFPEGAPLVLYIDDAASSRHLMTAIVQPSGQAVQVAVRDSTEPVLRRVFNIDAPTLQSKDWDLAQAIYELARVSSPGKAPADVVGLDFGCPPTIASPTNKNTQDWSAKLTIQGAGGATSKVSDKLVDVYMDLGPYGST